MIEEIEGIIENNENITPEGRIAMRTLVEKRSVALFPKPMHINDEVIENIKKKINSTRPCILSRNASVSLGEGARLKIDKIILNCQE